MSARQLIEERKRVAEEYHATAVRHRARFAAYGLTSRDLQVLVPVRLSWGERMTAALHGLAGGTQAVERWEQRNPALRTEIELWQLEHEALERRAASLSVEIDKKFSLPAACVVFVLLGAPLGMRVRRAGPAVAFVSVAFFLFYYLCLVGGEELANRLLLPPWLAMWLPNILLGAWGIGATLRSIEMWRPRASFALLRGRRPGRSGSSPALAGKTGGEPAA